MDGERPLGAGNTPEDYGKVIVQASKRLRERFQLKVGDVATDVWGVDVVLVGKGCNMSFYAESNREADFMIILVPAGLDTHDDIFKWKVEQPGRRYVYLQEVIGHDSSDPKGEIRRFNKMASFWSWRNFFFNDVPASNFLDQFTELFDMCGDYAGPYLTGEKSIESVPHLG